MSIPDANKEYMTWFYRGEFKQTDVAGGSIKIFIENVSEHDFFELEMLSLGPDTYATARSLNIIWNDQNDNIISILHTESLNNVRRNYPYNLGSNAKTMPNLNLPLIIRGKDYIEASMLSLAQNETFTVAIRIKFFNGVTPKLNLNNSSGTVTKTDEYEYSR